MQRLFLNRTHSKIAEIDPDQENRILFIPFQALTNETYIAIKEVMPHIEKVYVFDQMIDTVQENAFDQNADQDPAAFLWELQNFQARSEKINTTEPILKIKEGQRTADMPIGIKEIKPIAAKHIRENKPLTVYVIHEQIDSLQALINQPSDNFFIRVIPFDPAKSAAAYIAQIKRDISAKEDELPADLVTSQCRLSNIMDIMDALFTHLAKYLSKAFHQHDPSHRYKIETYISAIHLFYRRPENSLQALAYVLSKEHVVWKALDPLFKFLIVQIEHAAHYQELLGKHAGFVLTTTIFVHYVQPLLIAVSEFIETLSPPAKIDEMTKGNNELRMILQRAKKQLKLFQRELEIESNSPQIAQDHLRHYAWELMIHPELHVIDSEEDRHVAYRFLYETLKHDIQCNKENYAEKNPTLKPLADTIIPQVLRDLEVAKENDSYQEKFLILGGALITEYNTELDEKNADNRILRAMKSVAEKDSPQLPVLLAILQKYLHQREGEVKNFIEGFKRYRCKKVHYFYDEYLKMINVDLRQDDSDDEDPSKIKKDAEMIEDIPAMFHAFFYSSEKTLDTFMPILKKYAHHICAQTSCNDHRQFIDLAYAFLYAELEENIFATHNAYKHKENKPIKAPLLVTILDQLNINKHYTSQQAFSILLGALIIERDKKQERHKGQQFIVLTSSDQVTSYSQLLEHYPISVISQSAKQAYWDHVRHIKSADYFMHSLETLKKECDKTEIPTSFRVNFNHWVLDFSIETLLENYGLRLLANDVTLRTDAPHFKALAYEYLYNVLKKEISRIHDLENRFEISESLALMLEKLEKRTCSFQEKFEIAAGALVNENRWIPSKSSLSSVTTLFSGHTKEDKKIYDAILARLNLVTRADTYKAIYCNFQQNLPHSSYFYHPLHALLEASLKKAQKDVDEDYQTESNATKNLLTDAVPLNTETDVTGLPQAILDEESHLQVSTLQALPPPVFSAQPSRQPSPVLKRLSSSNGFSVTRSPMVPMTILPPPPLTVPKLLPFFTVIEKYLPAAFQPLVDVEQQRVREFSDNYADSFRDYFQCLIKNDMTDIADKDHAFEILTYEFQFHDFLSVIYHARDTFEKTYHQSPDNHEFFQLVEILIASQKSFEMKCQILCGICITQYTLCKEQKNTKSSAFFGSKPAAKRLEKGFFLGLIKDFPDRFSKQCIERCEEFIIALNTPTSTKEPMVN